MNSKLTGKIILTKSFIWGLWLFPAIISVIAIEQYGFIFLNRLGAKIDIKSPTDIFIFYSGSGATIAGVLLAVVTLILTLKGQVKVELYKANGGIKLFINLCFANSLVFILCSFCGIIGLYGLFPLKIATYFFIFGLWGLLLIGFITRNLLMDTTNTNSAIEGLLKCISSQLDLIYQSVSNKQNK